MSHDYGLSCHKLYTTMSHDTIVMSRDTNVMSHYLKGTGSCFSVLHTVGAVRVTMNVDIINVRFSY